MKRRKLFGSILIAIMFFNLNAQEKTIKTYSGKYEDGTATYQYYENENFERIYNGSFSYKEADYSNNKMNYKGVFINGNYKQNLKDGLWSFKKTLKNKIILLNSYEVLSYSLGYLNTYGVSPSEEEIKAVTKFKYLNPPEHIVTTQKGYYSNGMKSGNWIYEILDKSLNKKTVYSNVNFKNDTLIGKYSYKDGKITITAQFNNNGFADGEWKITTLNYFDEKIEDIRKYKDGVLYWNVKRNLSSGEILSKIDYSNKVDSLIKGMKVVIDNEYYVLIASNYLSDKDMIKDSYTNWQKNDAIDMLNAIIKHGNINKENEFIPYKKIYNYYKTEEGKKEKEIEYKYKSLISSGDYWLQRGKGNRAYGYYKEALSYKPNDKYAKKQIKEARLEQLKQEIYKNDVKISDHLRYASPCVMMAHTIKMIGNKYQIIYNNKNIKEVDNNSYLNTVLSVQKKVISFIRNCNMPKDIKKALKKANDYDSIILALGIE